MSRGYSAIASRRTIIAVATAVAAAVAAPLATPAHASTTPSLSTFDARLLHDINQARTSRGLRALSVVAGTTDISHRWSCHLASSVTLGHNPYLGGQLDTHGSSLWTTYGENVGVDSTAYQADHLFHLYMADPPHRANILDPSFRYVGIWTKTHNSRHWNTIDFVGSPVSSYSNTYGTTRVTC